MDPQTPKRGLERLNSRDARVLLLWLLAGLIGAGVAYRYFFRAFPEASVNFKVSRAAALAEARAFATAQGAELTGYESAIIFSVNDDAKTYLEREVGLRQANQLMESQVNVWYWDVRFFKPLQREEFHVHVAPDGRIVGYTHDIAEAAPGVRLRAQEARLFAEEFLLGMAHVPLDDYTFLPEEANSVARPNRTDWSFTWERTGFRAKDAPYRLNVTLQGDTIGSYTEFLRVPESWLRSYASLRSTNDFIAIIATIPYALLIGAALSVILTLGRRGLVRWEWALQLGLVLTVLYFAMQMDQWPLLRAEYDTNGPFSSFMALEVVKALAISVLYVVLVIVAVVPGEPLYRMGQPERLRLNSAFTLPGLRTKEFFRSGIIGMCLAGVHIGYITVFYIVGGHFGVWAPQDLKYSDTLSTALPWVAPLTIGIYAATSEEFLFRMFSIRFLMRTTKSPAAAVVLSAFAWGFLHANYPQEPPYIRGVEVGLMGIVAGMVMLRWGILATLTWHYTVDAVLSSLSLMRSGELYNQISGGIVGFAAVIPIGIAGAFYLTKGGFLDAGPLLNRAEPVVETPHAAPAKTFVPSAPTRLGYTRLATRALGVMGICGIAGLILLATVKPQEIGGFIKFPLDARQAEAKADDVLRQQNVNPTEYRRAATTQFQFDPLINEYLRRRVGLDAVNRIYREQVPEAFWLVRYFRDSEREEYLVVLLPDGQRHSVHHTVAEAAPGPNLSKEDALARATAYLHDVKGIDLSKWRLVEAQSNKLPARTDHGFIWEQDEPLNPATTPGDSAHARITLKVQGAEVTDYRIFIQVPEEWMRRQSQSTLVETVQQIGLVTLLGAFGIAVLVIFLRNLKAPEVGAVPWRWLGKWSLVVLAAAVAALVVRAPQSLLGYQTDQPFLTFVSTTAIQYSLGATLQYSVVFFLFGMAWFFLSKGYGAKGLPGHGRMPGAYYRDALMIGVSGFLTLAGIHRLGDLLVRIWPVARHGFPTSVPGALSTAWPAVSALAGGITGGAYSLGILVLALGFASCYMRRTWMQAGVLVLLALTLVPQSAGPGEFAQNAMVGFVELAVIWWGAQRVAGFNLLGYFIAAMLTQVVPAAQELLGQPNASYRANGIAVVAGLAALLLWTAAAWRRSNRSGGIERRAAI